MEDSNNVGKLNGPGQGLPTFGVQHSPCRDPTCTGGTTLRRYSTHIVCRTKQVALGARDRKVRRDWTTGPSAGAVTGQGVRDR
jgi:hypothetical protein